MTQVATHIAEALDLDLLLEVLARKLTLEADGAVQEREATPLPAREGTEDCGEVG